MKIEGEGKLLRVFVGESDKHGHKPLYQAIVEMLREEGLPKLDAMIGDGLVTLERVEVLAYRAEPPGD